MDVPAAPFDRFILKEKRNIAIVGGGAAGLRAAEVVARGDATVTVYDGMPSVGRKFLVAGKSGLNLTHEEDWDLFLSRYRGESLPAARWEEILSRFDNHQLRDWAAGLGIETFVASSGKVFPVPAQGMIKAAPLLRRWVERLRSLGVRFRMKHRWTGLGDGLHLRFQHGPDTTTITPDAVVLALGGASWPGTGSTGGWTRILESHGVGITPWQPANCGWEIAWPAAIREEAGGLPLKNVVVTAGSHSRRGELVLTRYGLEGGPLYHLGPVLRTMERPELFLDLKPDLTADELVQRFGKVKRNFVREARRRWKLDAAAASLLKHLPDRGPWRNPEALAAEVKQCRIPLQGPRPLTEAISSAGGIRWSELTSDLMIRDRPGIFVCGEMIDWEAPTGGYLLQACFATGSLAGDRALAFVEAET